MKVRKVIRKRLRHDGGTHEIEAGVDAVIAANVGERGAVTTSVRSHQQIVQRSRTKGDTR